MTGFKFFSDQKLDQKLIKSFIQCEDGCLVDTFDCPDGEVVKWHEDDICGLLPIKDICAAEDECAAPTTAPSTTTTTTTTTTTSTAPRTTTTTTTSPTTTTAPGPVWRIFIILDSIPSAYDANLYNEEQAIADLHETICETGFTDETTVKSCTVDSQNVRREKSRDSTEDGPISDNENLAQLDYISELETILNENEIADIMNDAFTSYSGFNQFSAVTYKS